MTRHAERHQILRIMRATVRERPDVMHKRRENVSAPLLAALAKWMRCQVSIANPAPCSAVSLVLIVAAREVIVVPLHCFLVHLAITAFSVRKIRTARHAAWSFRLSRHLHHLPSYRFHRMQKEHRRSCAPCFFQFILYHRNNVKIYENFPTTAKLCSALPCSPSTFR